MSEIPADILLYALIAAGLVFWLRNLLGTRHGEERERINPFTQEPETKTPPRQTETTPKETTLALQTPEEQEKDALPRNVEIEHEETWSDLSFIHKLDRNFDIGGFASAAQDAFVIVVEAFAKGDRETLKDLLSGPVYASFDQAISEREQKGETIATEIHAIRKVEVLSAHVEKPMGYITLRFIADETAVIRDKDGDIISGDPDRITEMNDIWVFSRNLKSKDPRWLVHETRDGNVKEEHKTPVPDSHE